MTSVLPTLAPSLSRAKGLRASRESAGGMAKLSNSKPGGAPPSLDVDFARGFVLAWRLRHGAKAAASVAARLGAPLSTVEKWFLGGAPSGPWFGPILAAYGPDFLDEALGGACPGSRAARREALERELSGDRDEAGEARPSDGSAERSAEGAPARGATYGPCGPAPRARAGGPA